MRSLAKIKWRCRRGTKELDYLLEAYCNKYYVKADNEEKAIFEQLLCMQDSELILFLLCAETPESKGLARVVEKIRSNKDF